LFVLLAIDADNESFQRGGSDAFRVEDDETGDFGRVEVLGQEVDDQDTRCDREDSSLLVHLLSLSDICQVRIDQTQSTAFWRGADGGVFGEGLSNPSILSVVCTDHDYQVVSGGIIRVEEVGDNTQEAEATRHDDELIFFAELFEYFLLELLYPSQRYHHHLCLLEPYQRQ
jgi:hypothetical protein